MIEAKPEVVPGATKDELRVALDVFHARRTAVDEAVQALADLRESLAAAELTAVNMSHAFGRKPIQHKGQVYSVQGKKLKRQELTNLDGA